MTPRRLALLRHGVAVGVAVVLAGCSTGDGNDINARGDTVATRPTSADGASSATAAPTTPDVPIPPETLPGEPASSTPASPSEPLPTPSPVSEVPETGVPGLDSDDAFCAAWSRFGGSFQVIAVNAAFGTGSVADRAFIEVAAGPSVVVAHAEMAEHWPDAIADDADVALGESFGPLERRLTAARDALVAEGATADQLDELGRVWLAFLAERDPADADVALTLDADLTSLVSAAVPRYLEQVGPWAEDESLIAAELPPLTDAYLATECPDQGTLAGGEIDG